VSISGTEAWLQLSSACQISNVGTSNETGIETETPSQREVALGLHNGNFTPQKHEFDWESGLDSRHVAFITDNDISWLFDDASFAQFGGSDSPLYPVPQSEALVFDRSDSPQLESVDLGHNTSKNPVEGAQLRAEAPSCGYRICNALTEKHRQALIAAIRSELTNLDFEDPVFSLANLRQGVHLYARYISKEFALFNHRMFAPVDEDKEEFREFYGEEPPLELIWAIITLGWTLSDAQSAHQVKVARMIQRVLRKFVITVSLDLVRGSDNCSLSIAAFCFYIDPTYMDHSTVISGLGICHISRS
jgi:hypothetical protein